jgi:hypothetical protein
MEGKIPVIERNKVYNVSIALLFLVGLFFILSSRATLTGAVVGADNGFAELRTIVGLLLLLVSVIVFYYSKHR